MRIEAARWRQWATVLVALQLLLLAACPAEERAIRVSAEGGSLIFRACADGTAPRCDVHPDHGATASNLRRQLRLVLLDQRGSVRDESKCVATNIEFAQAGTPTAEATGARIAAAINDALDAAAVDGLTFPDLEDDGDAQLLVLLYEDRPGPSDQPLCDPDNLIVCARFGAVGDALDISCATCEDGGDNGNCSGFLDIAAAGSSDCNFRRCYDFVTARGL